MKIWILKARSPLTRFPLPMFTVTRTSVVGLAPIHFLPCPRLLPIPGGLCAHTHAIPILVDRTLSLPLLVIFSLITFSFTCTISARRILSLFPLCPFHSTGTHPIITLNPLPYCWSMTSSPPTLTASSVGDSVPIIFTTVSVCDSISPLPFTLLLVSDSVPFLPAYLCTTTYSLVCAQVPYVYKLCVP